jgi:hypothetical protein
MRENGRSLPTSSRRGLDVCVAASAVAAHSTTPSRLIRLRLELEYQHFDTVPNMVGKGEDNTGTRLGATDHASA